MLSGKRQLGNCFPGPQKSLEVVDQIKRGRKSHSLEREWLRRRSPGQLKACTLYSRTQKQSVCGHEGGLLPVCGYEGGLSLFCVYEVGTCAAMWV